LIPLRVEALVGVNVSEHVDRFAAAGLNSHRDTEQWPLMS